MSSSLIDRVKQSDSINISKVSFDYRVDPSVIPGGTLLHYGVCPAKPKGKLLLDLDLAKFGFAGLDFHATATGAPAGQGSGGDPLIRWTVDQQVDKYLAAFDFTIERIKGHFTTVVHAIDPAVKAPSCDGPDRYFGAVLQTEGPDNGFVLTMRKTIAGVDHEGTVTVENFYLDAAAGEPLELGVAIKVPGSPCTKPIVEGGQAEAFAIVSGIPTGVTEGYGWRVEGGVPIGPTNQWRLTFTTPSTEPVFVSVEVTAGDQAAFDTATVLPLPAESLAMLTLLCRLRTLVRPNLFFDPLWDPLRNYAARPLVSSEIRRIGELATRLSRLARELEETARAADRRR